MPAHDDATASTLRFCASTPDGSVAPVWDDTQEAHLDAGFAVGGTVAERYFLQRKLGNGSMGRVFLAKDLRLDRSVALKVVLHRNRAIPELESILQREARLGASLNHRGIAAVYDFGLHEDKSYTVFEFVEGETLRTLLWRRGHLPLDELRPIVGELAAVLDFAHAHGVIHRDLKPENICLTKSGEFKILDFGLAHDARRADHSGAYSGTPAYSSPEQADCRPVDGKSDQYALALIVFEILTGRQAFADATPRALLRKQIEAAPPALSEIVPDLPEEVERAILRALSKHPEQRFASCQEFARELGAGRRGSPRHIVATRTESRLGFYISHVADESVVARKLGQQLERQRYSCWYYGRDAIPGVPFGIQMTAAIERSQAVLLLISRTAIRTPDFEREIEHAHRIRSPIIPVLIDLSREEFEMLAPAWVRLLDASPLIEYRRADSPAELLPRLLDAAERLEIAVDDSLAIPPEEHPRSLNGPSWATDANQIDILDLDQILFRNETIDDFLTRRHRHFISATKGFGKTLLLTCKRQLLTQAGAAGSQALTLVPEGRPFLDFMSEMRSLSDRYEKPLSSLSTTKRLWSAALRISAISHHPGVIDEAESSELEAFPERVQRWLQGARVQPTVVFKELTSVRVSELNQLIDRSENFLDQKLRQIHGGTYFFIDKVDQAIRHLSRDAWIAIQAGLIEAAWETMNANSHLKIYASIRQEAFTNYQSDIKSNLFAATTNLDYSDEDLQRLLDQLARSYEGCSSFADFLGLNVIRHGRRPAPEDSFRYVRRHTCGRPRDLVAIASELSPRRSSLNEKRLREIVQQTSSTLLVSNIFDEIRVFLNCLGDVDARFRFLAEIPGNILEKPEAVRVCERFNGLEPGTLQHFGEDSSDIHHPFRDLYLAGLLGVIVSDPERGRIVQRFRRPNDLLVQSATEIPDSPVFLIHPALDTFIRSQRTRGPFLQYQHITVGEDLPWEPYFPLVMRIEQHLRGCEDPRFVELAHQVVKRIQSALNSGKVPYARMEIENSRDWRDLWTRESRLDCSEPLLWLQELMNEL